MMHRNLDRRVECLVRLCDPRHVSDLTSLMTKGMSGDYSHWALSGDGRWTRRHVGADGEPLDDIQAAPHRDARQASTQGSAPLSPQARTQVIPAAGTLPWRVRAGVLEVAARAPPPLRRLVLAQGQARPRRGLGDGRRPRDLRGDRPRGPARPAPARGPLPRAHQGGRARRQGRPLLGRHGHRRPRPSSRTRSTPSSGSTSPRPTSASTTPTTATSCARSSGPTARAPSTPGRSSSSGTPRPCRARTGRATTARARWTRAAANARGALVPVLTAYGITRLVTLTVRAVSRHGPPVCRVGRDRAAHQEGPLRGGARGRAGQGRASTSSALLRAGRAGGAVLARPGDAAPCSTSSARASHLAGAGLGGDARARSSRRATTASSRVRRSSATSPGSATDARVVAVERHLPCLNGARRA